MKNIKIGEDYIYTLNNERVKVLSEDVNSDGDVIYACKQLRDNWLFWSGRVDLKEETPVPKGVIDQLETELCKIDCKDYCGVFIVSVENLRYLKHVMGLEKDSFWYCPNEIRHPSGGTIKIWTYDKDYANTYQGMNFTSIIIDKSVVKDGDFLGYMLSRNRSFSKYESKMVIV